MSSFKSTLLSMDLWDRGEMHILHAVVKSDESLLGIGSEGNCFCLDHCDWNRVCSLKSVDGEMGMVNGGEVNIDRMNLLSSKKTSSGYIVIHPPSFAMQSVIEKGEHSTMHDRERSRSRRAASPGKSKDHFRQARNLQFVQLGTEVLANGITEALLASVVVTRVNAHVFFLFLTPDERGEPCICSSAFPACDFVSVD